jgi:hypothetical protein
MTRTKAAPAARAPRGLHARRAGLAALVALSALVALATAGCHPTLAAESSAPPGRAARLDEIIHWFWGNQGYRLELSQGVALAVSCTRGGPCEKLVATSDDPAIAEVRPASLAALRPTGYHGNQQSAAAVVVVGKAPGATTIHVRSADGSRTIRVTVVAPPGTSFAATAAR